MINQVIWIPQHTAALEYAARHLEQWSWTPVNAPSSAVTHVLLPVPCRLHPDTLATILSPLPETVTVLGGFLDSVPTGRACINLLEDEDYQAENAMITAYCALRLGADALPVTWNDCPVLILGWGRIGKCLSYLLQRLGANVTIAARKESDLALARAFAYEAMTFREAEDQTTRFRAVFNTVPAPVLRCPATADCAFIELASKPGMDGPAIIDGRGLPGKMTPESAGALIARTVDRLCVGKELPL